MKNIYLIISIFLCLIFFNLRSQNFEWRTKAQYSATTGGTNVDHDSYGNIYVVGYYRDEAQHAPITAPKGCFFSKYNSQGILQWNKVLPKHYNVNLTVDKNNTILICGKDSAVCFISKYDTSGILLKKINLFSLVDCNYYADCFAIDTDSLRNYYLVGSYGSGTITLGSTTYSHSEQENRLFLAKYNSQDSCLWSLAQNKGYMMYASLSVSTEGNCYIGGYYYNVLAVNGTTLNSPLDNLNPGVSGVIGKIDPNGNIQWLKNIGVSGYSTWREVQNIKCDVNNNVYVSGVYSRIFSVGNTTLTAYEDRDINIFLIKYDRDGDPIWANQIGGYQIDVCSGLDVNENGVFVSGTYCKSANFDSLTVLTSFSTDPSFFMPYEPFIAFYNGNGKLNWAMQTGSMGGYANTCGGLTVFEDAVCVTGRFAGGMYFQGNPMYAAGDYMFLAKVGVNTVGLTINTQNQENDFKIFPNPGTGQLKAEGLIKDDNCINIYDVFGNKIYSQANIKDNAASIDLSNQESGIYFIEITHNEKKAVRKFILNK